jgi:C4-dicarboxylate transporter, DctQ subunit
LEKILNKLEETIIAVLLAAMTLVTFSQVVARYIFNSGAVWALELTTFLFAWLVLFGASYCVKIGAHIGIDMLARQFTEKTQQFLGLLSVFFCCIFSIILFIGSYLYVTKLYQMGIEAEDLPITEWKLKVILPIGFALIFFRLLQVGFHIWQKKHLSMHLATEAKESLDTLKD